MSNDSPQAVLRRIRAAWSTRRSCGLLAVAAGLRVERVVAVAAAGRLSPEDAMRMALEAEAVALPAAATGRPMPDVYRHLGRQAWSIRERGRVVGHAASVVLRDVTFRVSGPGVARIRRRGQREVVAHARGDLAESGPVPADAIRVRFNPYAATTFTLPDGSPISAAAVVAFLADGSCWAVPYPPECPHA